MGIDGRFYGPFTQQGAGEGVDCRDQSSLKFFQRPPDQGKLLFRSPPRQPFQFVTQPGLQLGGCFLGKSDRCNFT
jgi:hypothetical protein